jgi:hypothetical protein
MMICESAAPRLSRGTSRLLDFFDVRKEKPGSQ